MKLFHKNTFPELDIETARKILDYAFEVNQSEKNSVPLETLASYSNYRRERYSMQRTILIVMMTLFVLLPLLFIPPSFTLSSDLDDTGFNPVYRLELDTFMLVERLTVQIDGRNIPVYETDSHIYSIEPTKNGQMEITVTLLNQQTLTQSVTVTNVDKENPLILGNWMEDDLLYISLSDAGSGVNFEEIFGTNVDGEEVLPAVIKEEAGQIAFENPHGLVNIFIPDYAENVLQVIVASQ